MLIQSAPPIARSILGFLNGVHFTHLKLSSSLPHHPTQFSSWSQDSQIKYPFYSWEISSSFLPSMFQSGEILHEDAPEFQVHHSSFWFLLWWIQFKFSLSIIPASLIQMLFHTGAYLNRSSLYSYPECWRYRRRFMFSIQDPFKLFWGCDLIQVIRINRCNLSSKH
jgi:hypothetical protein